MREILEHFKKYFALTEVVSVAVANRYGEQAWSFFDPRLLEVLIWVRESIGRPMTINTKTMQQRGYRENTCQLVADKTKKGALYCTAHGRGQGVDFDVKGLTAEQVRQAIRQHIDECPHPIRLEAGVTWVHLDVCNITDKKLVEFKA